eukprot:Plantae.Rhodophyta-Purpureofilum_apyrenoidigerum.ctg2076.p1 GENE.Plantae.Rhodophyta-Purpureofilum_apyrenoidigerum.ctg2076~~Plantae.Rhodophyta-Purpureofilum_apyrenoidigerum.ctg2076.p1  ORF type:complete len:311 (-),score=71.74 Plantae.Rhodophyta-Purpureofilum_apyrenoidigerum.ctg2076:67-903(-)
MGKAAKSKGKGEDCGQKRSLYDVLQVSKDASVAEIKRAYRLLALKLHPDKNKSEDAAEKFQQLQKVYEVLGDKEKRAVYDESGVIVGEDDEIFPSDMSAEEVYRYFREMYKTVTEEDVENYMRTYRHGEPEKEDLMSHFKKFEGDVDLILSYIPYSEECDLARFIEFYDERVKDGSLSDSKKYQKSRKHLMKQAAGIARREDLPAESCAVSKKRKKSSTHTAVDNSAEASLAATILARRSKREQNFDDFTDRLAAKYGPSRVAASKASSKRIRARKPS